MSGMSYGAISQQVGLARSTVQYTIKRAPSRRESRSNPRSGRPQVLSPRLKRLITRTYERNPKMSYAELIEETCPGTHRNTVLKYVKTTNVHKWRCLKRPLLTQADADRRLGWAREHIRWTRAQWARIRWSDECSIERGKGVKPDWVFRRPREGLFPWAVQPKARGTRHSIMFWAAFGFGIRSDLVVCEGDPKAAHRGFTARKYRDLLQEHLGTVLDHDSIFMQDNASIHTAHIVREWLDEHAIQVMDWPPYSPDLNPIENIWALLKQKIYELRPDLIEHSNIAMLSVLQRNSY